MPRPKKANPAVESAEALAAALAGFDYEIEPDAFVLYEVARLIEEDRASFDDEEFRGVIDDGVQIHVEENLVIRANLSRILRQATLPADTSTAAMRVVHAVEDLHSNLRNVSSIVRSFTMYVFDRLQALESNAEQDSEARAWIDRWQAGEILREQLIGTLIGMQRAAVAPAADLLFEATEDRMAAEAAIAVLSAIHSSASARVLAHTISEPLLDEDLESAAYAALKGLWPLSRDYMLCNLRAHSHEDIPIRWFQLLVEKEELSSVELALEELRSHGNNPVYQEDLAALLDALQNSRDPETEDKILATMNAPETPSGVLPLLEEFVRGYRRPEAGSTDSWSQHAMQLELNEKYIGAARLYDAGKKADALVAVDEILKLDSQYPFAVMLKSLA